MHLGFLIFFAGLAVGGLGTVTSATISRRRGEASARWPRVTGTVLSSYVDESGDSADTPVVVYRYEVRGEMFRGKKICFGTEVSFLIGRAAQAVVDRYPVGAPVTVYYDPVHPRSSVLKPGIPPHNGNLMTAGATMIVVGCVGTLVTFAI